MEAKVAQDSVYESEDWWDWSVWIEAPDHELDRVEYVQYTLHSSFPNPVRRITDRPGKFKLSTSGWGTFTIYVTIHMKDGSEVELTHELELYYPDGKVPLA